MGELVTLSTLRARREARTRRAAEAAAAHPALRWVAGETYYLAHRRDEAGSAACGMHGRLTLAPPGVPLCQDCYA